MTYIYFFLLLRAPLSEYILCQNHGQQKDDTKTTRHTQMVYASGSQELQLIYPTCDSTNSY